MDYLVSPDMSLELAERLLDDLKVAASALGIALAGVVVDRAGNPVASCRMDGAQLGASSIASDKAYTAAAFGQPTAIWAKSSGPSGGDWGLAGTLGGRCIVFPGGVPVYSEHHLLGALGVSGAASAVDQECAEKAVLGSGLSTVRS